MRLILAGLITIAGLVPWVLYLRLAPEARAKSAGIALIALVHLGELLRAYAPFA